MLRGEMLNNSRLMLRKDERDYLSLPLKKGNIDTTFNIPNEGEAFSFYFLTDSPGSLELAGNIPLVESLFDIKETGSDRIGSLELILRR